MWKNVSLVWLLDNYSFHEFGMLPFKSYMIGNQLNFPVPFSLILVKFHC